MKRITLAKNATWALAFLMGAGAFVFALAYVAFPPRRPASPYAQWAAKPHEPPALVGRLDKDRIVRDISKQLGCTDPPIKNHPFDGAALAGTTTGHAGSTAAITMKDGTQVLLSEKDRRVTDISPGTVTLEDGTSLNTSRGERR